jgi:hypothetical protein
MKKIPVINDTKPFQTDKKARHRNDVDASKVIDDGQSLTSIMARLDFVLSKPQNFSDSQEASLG